MAARRSGWPRRPPGSLVIALTVDSVDDTVAVSQVLAVAVDRRRRYIGYELKRTALEWFHDQGGQFVYSEVDDHNVAMRACNRLFEAVEDAAEEEAGLLDVVVHVTE